MINAQLNITPPHPTPPHLQHSHGENLPHLSGLPGTTDRATSLGEVSHLSCESSQEKKKRDCMERLVTPPRRGTKPTWGPPPPCEQALRDLLIVSLADNLSLYRKQCFWTNRLPYRYSLHLVPCPTRKKPLAPRVRIWQNCAIKYSQRH